MKEIFLQWLDDKGLLEIYLLELLASDWRSILNNQNDFVAKAFSWADSCNGCGFWLNVSKEWYSESNSIKQPNIFNKRF